MTLSRRSFLLTLATPAIVHASSLMPVRLPKILQPTPDELHALLRQRMNDTCAELARQLSRNLYAGVYDTPNIFAHQLYASEPNEFKLRTVTVPVFFQAGSDGLTSP